MQEVLSLSSVNSVNRIKAFLFLQVKIYLHAAEHILVNSWIFVLCPGCQNKIGELGRKSRPCDHAAKGII